MEQMTLFSRVRRTLFSQRDRLSRIAALMAQDGKTEPEIAERIGCSIVDVKSRILRGKLILCNE